MSRVSAKMFCSAVEGARNCLERRIDYPDRRPPLVKVVDSWAEAHRVSEASGGVLARAVTVLVVKTEDIGAAMLWARAHGNELPYDQVLNMREGVGKYRRVRVSFPVDIEEVTDDEWLELQRDRVVYEASLEAARKQLSFGAEPSPRLRDLVDRALRGEKPKYKTGPKTLQRTLAVYSTVRAIRECYPSMLTTRASYAPSGQSVLDAVAEAMPGDSTYDAVEHIYKAGRKYWRNAKRRTACLQIVDQIRREK